MVFRPRTGVLLFAVAGCLASPLRGQIQSQPVLPDAPSAAPQVDTTITVYAHETEAERREWIHSVAERELKAEEKQRILTVVPNFNTVISGRAMPLSSIQKLDLAVHNVIDPFNIVGAVVLAGASELTDTHTGYGWGPGGFAKRTGANYADVTDGTMLAGAVFPILPASGPTILPAGNRFDRLAGSARSVSAVYLPRGQWAAPGKRLEHPGERHRRGDLEHILSGERTRRRPDAGELIDRHAGGCSWKRRPRIRSGRWRMVEEP